MGRIIALSIAALILVLLITPLNFRFEYSDELRIKINWLFITIVRFPAKTGKMKRHDRKAAEEAVNVLNKEEEKSDSQTQKAAAADAPQQMQEKSEAPQKSSSGKLTLKEILTVVKFFRDSLNKPLKKLCKATRVYGFRLDIVVGGDDAARAAIKFGEMNIAAGSAIAFLDSSFTMKKPDYNITCDFLSEETRTECSFTARVTVIVAIVFLLWFIGRAVRNYIARKDAAEALEKIRK